MAHPRRAFSVLPLYEDESFASERSDMEIACFSVAADDFPFSISAVLWIKIRSQLNLDEMEAESEGITCSVLSPM